MKYVCAVLLLTGLAACGVGDMDGVGQTYVIDHSAYNGTVYWQQ